MKTEFNCGNFEVSVDVMFPDETPVWLQKLGMEGVTQLLQRKPVSDWEKAAAGDSWPVGERGGRVRPSNFKRDSIPFSTAEAESLEVFCREAVEKLGVEHFEVYVSEKPEGDSGKSRKLASNFYYDLLHKDPTTLGALLMAYGVSESASVDEKIEVLHQRAFAKRK